MDRAFNLWGLHWLWFIGVRIANVKEKPTHVVSEVLWVKMFLFSSHEREATCPKWTLAFKSLHFPVHHWNSLSQCLSLSPNATSSGRAPLTTLTNATLPASLPRPAHYSGLLSREQASLFKTIYLLSYLLSCLLDIVSSSLTGTQAPWDQKVVLFNSP